MKWKCFSMLILCCFYLPTLGHKYSRLYRNSVEEKNNAISAYFPNEPESNENTGNKGMPSGSCPPTEQSCDRNQMAAKIAAKAAQVATAANEAQSNAAECAAKEVRIQLAEKAVQASRAVQAVLEGKRALLDKIERELHASEDLLAKLVNSLQLSEQNVQKAECVFKSSEARLNRLSEILQLFNGNLADVDSLNEQAQTDYNEKRQMLIAAKERWERIQKDISNARDEYQHVKMAAYQAACAAVEAKQKAAHCPNDNAKGNPNQSCPNVLQQRRRRQRQRHRKSAFRY